MIWKRSIVRYGETSVDQLLSNPENFKIHSIYQQAAVEGSLNEIGWIDEITINLRTHPDFESHQINVETMVDGHLRVILAMRLGEKTVPAKWVDLSPEEELKAMLYKAKTADMAGYDAEKLKAALERVNSPNKALQNMMNELAIESGLLRFGSDGRYHLADFNLDFTSEVTADILIRVPISLYAQVKAWLSNGEEITPEGIGRGAVKRMLNH